ncbi:MAG: cytochrome c oxidase subunit 3 family protein [Planctomycetota bacterium]|nr:cytochrome c oxidase subunit 3 family protein [Planctomycetota bacterium]
MTTLDARNPSLAQEALPAHERYKHGHHFRNSADEFDACKTGFWLFLATEVLLFAGLFVAYGVFRMLYPEAFANGSHYLDWRWGGLNTVVLLISSYTMAMSIHHTQHGRKNAATINLLITLVCGLGFLLIKFIFEYAPKWEVGKRPGQFFFYPFSQDAHEPLWWSVYYCATGIHALHVIIGMGLIARALVRLRMGYYGPKHYTFVELTGLYWHLVDLVWIFLFPLLYLIH